MTSNAKTVTRLCPICDTARVEVLLDLEITLQADWGMPDSYSVVECTRCGFVYQDSAATLANYESYYENANKYHSSPTIFEETKELFGHYRGLFDRYVKRENRILDMGCAGGIFLELLKGNGYTNVVGIDPSARSVVRIREKGIEAHVGGI